MRSKSLLGLVGLLGFCCTVLAEPGEDRPVASEKSSVSRDVAEVAGPSADLVAKDDEPGVAGEMVIYDISPDKYFKRVVMGPDGKVRDGSDDAEGSVAGPGERLIYENTLGINAINFPVNLPISDDIATTAPDNCNLTRYKFRVLGKVNPGGLGGDYQVTYGLYSNCPMAVGTTNAQRDLVRIPGTEGVIPFVGDEPREIEHIVPAGTPVALPTNVYLGIRFNRANCGTVVGAPAMIGISGDIWDHPSFPCNGYLGGFPGLPQASFWAEIYGTTNCTNSFVAYKCQRPSSSPALLGANIEGVDDVKLIVANCQMVGYEVVVKGVGLYTFDLRRQCNQEVIPGTQKTFQVNANTQPQLQVARFSFSPPVPLNSENIFLSFKVDSGAAGAILAGVQPIIGETSSDWFEIGLEGCSPRQPVSGVIGSINLAITCGGTQALGACCDPHLTQCNLGPDVGKRCNDNSMCTPPGTCEAVCRETTEYNCPFPPRGQDLKPKWEQGESCDIVCEGGANDGNPCTSANDCPGGGECPAPFQEPCGVAACCHMRLNPANQQLEEKCTNLTKNQCAEFPPLDKPRLWQLGWYCGNPFEQRCPRNACLARDGSCYVSHVTPGCNDPFCCTDVCTLHGAAGSHCCDVNWDNTCVSFAQLPISEGGCSRGPGNDQCAPGVPDRRLEGALTIPYPGSAANSNERASLGAEEPGFCCNNGTGVCIGGQNPGMACITNTDCGGTTCSDRIPNPGGPAINPIWFKFTLPMGSCQAGFPSGGDPCKTNADCRICVGGTNADRPCTVAGDCPGGGTCPAGGTCNGAVTTAQISTCASNSPALDSVMQVFKAQDTTSAQLECLSLTPVACNDDAANCGSTERNSRACLTGGTPGGLYYVMVGAKTQNRVGEYRVTLAATSCSTAGTIANDYCVKATAVTDATPADPLVIPFNTGRVCSAGANIGLECTTAGECPGGSCLAGAATYDCPSPSCIPNSQNDVWWDYTATCTGEATFSTCGGTNPDTNLAVYEGCSKCPSAGQGDSLAPIGCNEDIIVGGCGLSSRVTADVTCGQCYKVRVADTEGFPVAGNLTITCSGTCQSCAGMVSSAPTTCSIDARIPHVQNNAGQLRGWNSVDMTFEDGCNVASMAPADFSVACTPAAGAPCPTVTQVNDAGQVVTVTLSSVIPAQKWTCVTHIASGDQVCVGSLPGDCNSNGATLPSDIIDIVDNNNGIRVPPLTLNQCDLDRSGVCLPADIITLIDMLNGLGFSVWNGKTLESCPAAP